MVMEATNVRTVTHANKSARLDGQDAVEYTEVMTNNKQNFNERKHQVKFKFKDISVVLV